MKFAYADPPYPGLAAKYYKDQPTYAGEVDHVALIASLKYSYDGWALSTSVRGLREVLPLCPPDARVCAWVKPIGVSSLTYGLHNTWEPLIVVGGRRLRPGRRDWLRAMPARGGGDLPGRKPISFCAWLFECLGMLPGDELVDLFPGTGVVGRAWAESGRPAAPGDRSFGAGSDASPGDGEDTSRAAANDPSDGAERHVAYAGVDDTSADGKSDRSAPVVQVLDDASHRGLSDPSPRAAATVRA
jgi:hypothetical protein